MKPLFVTIVALIMALSPCQATRAAPADGEQKCGPDGSVMRFDTNTQSWVRTVAPCDPPPSQKTERRDDGREQPANGDAKCGPDGYVLRYSASDHAWQQSVARCQ